MGTNGLPQEIPSHADENGYHRYRIEIKDAPHITPLPSHFRVKVKKRRLASFLLRELIHYRGNRQVISNRPCVYGVFSGPIGGFAPRERSCVGCLRCTTQYPETVQVYHNLERQQLGDSYFTSEYVDAVSYEAQTGRILVKGAGYRGKFGGEGWDGMWTDMSEIVRPTRDGIHGREFISTVVDVGEILSFLSFDEQGLQDPKPHVVSIPLPFLFEVPAFRPPSQTLLTIFAEAARELETLVIVPVSEVEQFQLTGTHVVPLVTTENHHLLTRLPFQPSIIELGSWDENVYQEICSHFPGSILSLRFELGPAFEERMLACYRSGARVFHLKANYHGRGTDGQFVRGLIRKAHEAFVGVQCRDAVTLLGSGGVIAAEHAPKAIICGLDCVVLDTPLLVALQAMMVAECVEAVVGRFEIPTMKVDWGVQRLKNLMNSWRDQLLEVLGAMGMREVRRLRGEIGRAMFQTDLEREAFGEISGYAD